MRAATCDRYGAPDVVRLREVPTPCPARGELLIRIHASTVSTGDWRVRSLTLPPGFGPFGRLAFGLVRPRQPILGTELAGTVEGIGEGVTQFGVGDEVIAFADTAMGCHAEYRTIAADAMVVRKPARLSWEQAAALAFGGMTMRHYLRRGALARGDRVLVNGATGTVGSAAVQLAVQAGAEVTAVCSAANAAIARVLGAPRVIDYAREDFAASAGAYDIIVDTVGNAPYRRVQGALAPGGRLLVVLGGLVEMLLDPVRARRHGHRVVAGPAQARVEDLRALAALAESGAYTPLIDAVYPLERIVDAHRRVETGRKRGSVIVTMGA